MLSAAQFANVLRGLRRLVLFDRGGFALFDATVPGFWASFRAAAMVYPVILLNILLRHDPEGPAGGFMAFTSLETMRYIIVWLIYPLAMFHLTALLGVRQNFLRYIVAYNWFHLVSAVMILPALLLAMNGIEEPAQLFGLVYLTATMSYMWFLLRHGLGISVSAAIALALFDLLFSEVVGGVIYMLVGV